MNSLLYTLLFLLYVNTAQLNQNTLHRRHAFFIRTPSPSDEISVMAIQKSVLASYPITTLRNVSKILSTVLFRSSITHQWITNKKKQSHQSSTDSFLTFTSCSTSPGLI